MSGEFRQTGLVLPDDLSYEEWLEIGRKRLAPAASQLAWLIGDWLVYADGRYGGRGREGRDLLALDAGFLRDVEQVAGRTREIDRRPDVPWGQYLLSVRRHGRITAELLAEVPDRCRSCRGALYSLTRHKRKYCSDGCRQRGYRRRRANAAAARSGRDEGGDSDRGGEPLPL